MIDEEIRSERLRQLAEKSVRHGRAREAEFADGGHVAGRE